MKEYMFMVDFKKVIVKNNYLENSWELYFTTSKYINIEGELEFTYINFIKNNFEYTYRNYDYPGFDNEIDEINSFFNQFETFNYDFYEKKIKKPGTDYFLIDSEIYINLIKEFIRKLCDARVQRRKIKEQIIHKYNTEIKVDFDSIHFKNSNMIRVMKEQANKKRDISPRTSDGYLLINFRHEISDRITRFIYEIQTPFSFIIHPKCIMHITVYVDNIKF